MLLCPGQAYDIVLEIGWEVAIQAIWLFIYNEFL